MTTANVTIEEFISGETLEYRDPIKGTDHTITYRVGVGMLIDGKLIPNRNGMCSTDLGAKRTYRSLTDGHFRSER